MGINVRPPNWLALQAYCRVVELHSFSAAARHLEMTGGAVSKLVAQLEADVGVRLLQRTTRSLQVTEEGQRFYAAALRLQEDMDSALDEARHSQASLTGRLRVAVPTSFALMWLSKRLPPFLGAHPHLTVELDLNDRYVDLVAEGMDCALRVAAQLPDSSLVARPLGAVQRVLVASPAYLASAPALTCPDDLAQHACLIYTQTEAPGAWALTGTRSGAAVQVQGRYRVNNSVMLREALLAGQGVTLTPRFVVHDLLASGQLQELLPAHRAPDLRIFGVVARPRYTPRKVQVFLDYVAQQVDGSTEFVAPVAADPQ